LLTVLLSTGYQLTKKLSGSVGYQYTLRTSGAVVGVPSQGYSQNLFYLSLTYQF